MLRVGNGTHDHGFGGGALERTVLVFAGLPLPCNDPPCDDKLISDGWVKSSDRCDPYIGYQWHQGRTEEDKAHPLVLYTTKAGQPSGVGVRVYGALPELQQKWANGVSQTGRGELTQEIRVAFREGDIICSGEQSEAVLGDRLIVNPGANVDGRKSKALPMNESSAFSEGWHRGACGDGMGWHWWLDTKVGNNRMSWDANNLFPVIPMYHEGEINAILFASWVVQHGLISSREWDPVPEPNALMCLGLCDSDCTFKGTNMWSGMHVFFRDHKEVKCDAALHCHMGQCCDPSTLVV